MSPLRRQYFQAALVGVLVNKSVRCCLLRNRFGCIVQAPNAPCNVKRFSSEKGVLIDIHEANSTLPEV
jgi:hypothetical protein